MLRAESIYISWRNRRRLRWLAKAGYGDTPDQVADMIVENWTSEKFPQLAELEAQIEALESEIPLKLGKEIGKEKLEDDEPKEGGPAKLPAKLLLSETIFRL